MPKHLSNRGTEISQRFLSAFFRPRSIIATEKPKSSKGSKMVENSGTSGVGEDEVAVSLDVGDEEVVGD